MSENSELEIDPCERRVIYVEPITDDHGSIEVQAVYRYPEPATDRIDSHIFSFTYTYLADDRCRVVGLNEWKTPTDSVTAVDMAVYKYVTAYFNDYGLSVSDSIPIGKSQLTEFEADVSLEIRPESEETDDSTQWVEGP